MRRLFVLCGLCVLCVSILAPVRLWADDEAPPNPLMDKFLKKGIEIPGIEPFILPKPLVREGMTPEELQKALKEAAGKLPLKLFLKGDRYSPNNIVIEPVPKKGKGIRQAHHVRLHMIALGKVEDVIEKNLLNQLIGGAKGKSKSLDAAQLQERKLVPLAGKGMQEQFEVLDMELLEKVNISGITRSIKTFGGKAAYTSTILDERFAKDKKHPNAWQHVDANGTLIGKSSPYSGMGGYVLALQLPDRKGKNQAVYLEMHYILHEPKGPKGWFPNADPLSNRLRPLIDDNAREFRRKLAQGKR